MHDTLKPSKTQKKGDKRLSSRTTSILAAAAAAAVAALLIVVFLQKYRKDLETKSVPVGALVADRLIEKGASADTAGAQGQFSVSKMPRDEVKPGALTDAAALKGQVAAADILPGQQITAADFKPAGNGLVTKLGPDDRAVTVALDSQHALGGQLVAGDHVDVFVDIKVRRGGEERAVLKTLMQNILVLSVPGTGKTASGESDGTAPAGAGVTLRVSSRVAGQLAWSADNGQVWLSLRSLNGRNVANPQLVTVESVLAARSAGIPAQPEVAR